MITINTEDMDMNMKNRTVKGVSWGSIDQCVIGSGEKTGFSVPLVEVVSGYARLR